MKRSSYLAIVLCLIFAGCKENEEPPIPIPDPDPLHIYVSGNIRVNNKNIPAYWKDGELFELPYEADLAEATGIFISGTDVYVSGYTFNSATQGGQAVYWKNGVPTYLTEGDKQAGLRSIFLSNGDVYATGYEKEAGNYVAKFWKNGVPTNLADGSTSSQTNKIFIAENKVYIVGTVNNATTGAVIPTYWVDGVPSELTPNNRSGYLSGLFVLNKDVYVSGREDGPRKGVFWKNGNRTELSSNGWVSGIAADSTAVYTSVSDYSTGTGIAKYFINSQEMFLTDGSKDAESWDIYTFENKVYVVGYEYNGTTYEPRLWIDGEQSEMENKGTYTYTNGIFVVRHP